jgi:hypothetical protein
MGQVGILHWWLLPTEDRQSIQVSPKANFRQFSFYIAATSKQANRY